MMKILLTVFGIIAFALSVYAQGFQNDWINYNNKYLYFKIVDKGIYRLDYPTLNSALNKIGTSITNPSFNHSQLQLVKNGKQVPLFIEDGGDGNLDPGDFIEFFGEGNDGWLDSALYEDPNDQNNPNYSFFSDTAYYYLTLEVNSTNERITEFSDLNYSALSPANYVINRSFQQYTTNYETGATDFSGKTEAEYTEGEGWFDGVFTYLGSKTKNLSTPNVYTGTGAPNVTLNTVVTGASNASNISGDDHRLGVSFNGSLFFDFSFEGYRLLKINETFAASQITGNTTPIKFESLPLPNPPASDRMAVSYVELIYPQTTNFGGASTYELWVAPNAAKTRLDISSFSTNTVNFVYDFNSRSRCEVSQTGSSVQVILPPGPQKRCYISTENQIRNITTVEAINGNGTFVDFSQNPPDSAYLIITHQKLLSSANQFALRKSQEGLNPLVIDVEELYHQFAFGVRKHPLSIRGFADYALQSWPTPPQYLFLVGKSISAYLCRRNTTNYGNNLVPSFGFPTTDILLTAGLNNTKWQPALATGRLVALNNADVLGYAEKVDQFYQSQQTAYNFQNKEWMRNILHFGGGTNANEQLVLRNYLLDYEELLTDTFFGGEVTSFFKNTSSVIQTTVSDSVRNLINNGISLLNFFGHASGTALDISIDDVNTYDNFGKYFLFVANSCNVGDIHTPVQAIEGINQSFVLTPGKGAIAFLASVTLGYPSRLNLYTHAIYENMVSKNYGMPLGKIMIEAIKDVQDRSIMRSTCREMTLHGDPSLKMYPHPKPDYVLSPERTSIDPQKVSAELSEFNLNVLVTNIGKAVKREVGLQVKRTFPDGTDAIFTTNISTPIFRDTVNLTIPVFPEKSIGRNIFELALDYPIVTVDEMDNTSNNLSTYEVWITSDEVIPVYPSNLEIIEESGPTFYTISADPNATTNEYFFELDTTDKFNSPLLISLNQSSKGGVIKWKPNITYLPDSAVYFWRVSPKPNPDYKWREASFTYIPNKRGWGQTNFNQLKENRFTFLNYNQNNKSLSFLPNQKQLAVQILGHPKTQTEYNFQEFRLDGELIEFGVCPPAAPSIYVAVFDSSNLEPWGTHFIDNSGPFPIEYNPNNSFGNNNDLGGCRSRVEYFFTYVLSNPAQVNSLENLLNNEIPVGNYVLAYTIIRGDFKDSTIWDNFFFQAFEGLGATQIRTVGDSIPYIFFAQKGRKSTAKEALGNNYNDVVNLTASLQNNLSFGSYETPRIGPSNFWQTLNWDFKNNEINRNDSVTVELFGINSSGNEVKLLTQKSFTGSNTNLPSIIEAQQYPFAKLKVAFKDDSLQTPLNPNYLHIVYDKAPDYVAESITSISTTDTIMQGAELSMLTNFSNIGFASTDSISINYTLSSLQTDVSEVTENALLFSDNFSTITDTFKVNTLNLFGLYALTAEINPRFPDSLWKPEQFTFNNSVTKFFYIQGDNTNPTLDVTFDGIHILNGDIVSPNPEIKIWLDDENEFLALNDTSLFSLYLIDPANTQRRIPFVQNGVENIQFQPGQLPENKAELTYFGNFTEDGDYTLIVKASDASSNRSGEKDYKISFEVINRSTITEIMNYPNPFTTSTRFVFTLTGSKIPNVFTIQILTVTGKVIREITKQELGNLRIGRNITEYAWDGRDEFGDRLGNGVYLYRVITKIEGETIEKRQSGADRFFNQGLGKMYLMR